MTETPTIYRGLEDVLIDTTQICFIDGDKGELVYRGYPIEELASKVSFEEVTYLLWNTDLPTKAQLEGFRGQLKANYALPNEILDLLHHFSKTLHPMHALRTAISMLAAYDEKPDDLSPENIRRIGYSLVAKLPTLVATLERVRNDLTPVFPNPDFDIATNFLYMLTGEKPSNAAVHVMDTALVLHAEHSVNASTFVARSTASSLADVFSSITAAAASLKGPSHGGANMATMQALESIGEVNKVDQYVLDTLAKPGGRVMGFGHRVYKVLDPRAAILKEVAQHLSDEQGGNKWFQMSLEMEKVMDREMTKKGKPVKPNVDFFSASIYRMLGFPTDMFTPIFAVARVAGWMAHLYEQYANNRIMRPDIVYEGPKGKTFKPLEKR
ncbi:MAG: citrate/2-methylcitrate synthase [Trueperaceae bacterium]